MRKGNIDFIDGVQIGVDEDGLKIVIIMPSAAHGSVLLARSRDRGQETTLSL